MSRGDEKQPGRVKGVLKRASVWTGISAAVLGSTAYVVAPGVVEAYAERLLGPGTAQERIIEDAAAKVYGKSIVVHCTNKVAPLFESQGESVVLGSAPMIIGINKSLGVILLRNSICDTLSDLVADPEGDNEANMMARVAAIHELSHELSHVKGNGDGEPVGNESIVECYAYQRAEAVAEALGVPHDVAKALALTGAAYFDTGVQEYAPPANCVDGGPYDLNPAQPGIFPRQTNGWAAQH